MDLLCSVNYQNSSKKCSPKTFNREKYLISFFPGKLESVRGEGKVESQVEVEILLSENLHEVCLLFVRDKPMFQQR